MSSFDYTPFLDFSREVREIALRDEEFMGRVSQILAYTDRVATREYPTSKGRTHIVHRVGKLENGLWVVARKLKTSLRRVRFTQGRLEYCAQRTAEAQVAFPRDIVPSFAIGVVARDIAKEYWNYPCLLLTEDLTQGGTLEITDGVKGEEFGHYGRENLFQTLGLVKRQKVYYDFELHQKYVGRYSELDEEPIFFSRENRIEV